MYYFSGHGRETLPVQGAITTRHGGVEEGDRSGSRHHGARQSVGQPEVSGQQRQYARHLTGTPTFTIHT